MSTAQSNTAVLKLSHQRCDNLSTLLTQLKSHSLCQPLLGARAAGEARSAVGRGRG